MHIDDNGIVQFDADDEAEFEREIEIPALESLRRWYECVEQLGEMLLGPDWER